MKENIVFVMVIVLIICIATGAIYLRKDERQTLTISESNPKLSTIKQEGNDKDLEKEKNTKHFPKKFSTEDFISITHPYLFKALGGHF